MELNDYKFFRLPENLRILRKRLNMSQEELAEKIGLKRGNIASYENGSAEPKLCNLIKIAQLFNVSINDLMHTNLEKDDSYLEATIRHQNGHSPTHFPAVGLFMKEADDYAQAIRGLHCLFRLKLKNPATTPSAELQFAKEQFEQLHSVATQLLDAHLELIKLIRHRYTDDGRNDNCSSLRA